MSCTKFEGTYCETSLNAGMQDAIKMIIRLGCLWSEHCLNIHECWTDTQHVHCLFYNLRTPSVCAEAHSIRCCGLLMVHHGLLLTADCMGDVVGTSLGCCCSEAQARSSWGIEVVGTLQVWNSTLLGSWFDESSVSGEHWAVGSEHITCSGLVWCWYSCDYCRCPFALWVDLGLDLLPLMKQWQVTGCLVVAVYFFHLLVNHYFLELHRNWWSVEVLIHIGTRAWYL